MWSAIFSTFVKGNGIKIGVAAGGSISVFTLIMSLHGNISKKIEDSQKEQKSYMREYVELTIRPITTELKNQKVHIKETKELVRDIHNYLLKRK